MATALLAAALVALVGSILLGLAGWVAAWIRVPAPVVPTLAAVEQTSSADSAAIVALWLALGFLVGALGIRALDVGHAPWSNMYEFNQAFAGGILATYLAMARRQPIARLAPLVAAAAAALLVYDLTLTASAKPLPPALQTPLLLTVHVGSAVLAYAIYAVAGSAAAAEIAQRFAGDQLAWLPSAAVCRAAAYRAAILGLPVLTLAIVLGALWANVAWRSYWNNDPKELAAAATWLIYAAYLHVGHRRDRWGRAAPWLLVAGFGAVLFTYFAANLVIPGQHSYSGV